MEKLPHCKSVANEKAELEMYDKIRKPTKHIQKVTEKSKGLGNRKEKREKKTQEFESEGRVEQKN